jgi:hypothetical protein
MVIHFSHRSTVSGIPERIEVTQDLERRYAAQEAAKAAAKAAAQQTRKTDDGVKGQS